MMKAAKRETEAQTFKFKKFSGSKCYGIRNHTLVVTNNAPSVGSNQYH